MSERSQTFRAEYDEYMQAVARGDASPAMGYAEYLEWQLDRARYRAKADGETFKIEAQGNREMTKALIAIWKALKPPVQPVTARNMRDLVEAVLGEDVMEWVRQRESSEDE